ncbi:ABC transporter ATP-binding protein [Haloglycomyces albus]|uniref:ABC transporter ATP-binding protein n=1 Tax=Haloglycomyces albus TaxID=526067 RepID=UPI00046D797D|nr:ABC transporter ATP-binding protein [Haloglycomyces albus]
MPTTSKTQSRGALEDAPTDSDLQHRAGRLPVADGRRILRTLREVASAHKALVTGFLLCFTVGFAATALIPVLLGSLIDGLAAGWSVTRINWTCAALVLALVTAGVFVRSGALLGRRFGEQAAAMLRERFTARVLELDLGTVEAAGRGDLATRTSADIAAATRLFHTNGPDLLSGALEIAVLAVAALIVQPVLGLGVAIVIVPLVVTSRIYWRRSQGLFVAERAAMSEIADNLGATVDGSRTVENYRLHRRREDAVETEAAGHQRLLYRIRRLFAFFLPAADLTLTVPIVLVTLAGGLWYLGWGGISVGAISAVAMLALRLDGPLYRVLFSLVDFQQGAAAVARVEGVAALEPPRKSAVPHGHDIEFRHVTFGYGDGPDVLKDVNLIPATGRRLAIVGPSGSGKSTLARLLAGIDCPRSGSVTIGGAEASQVETELLRRSIILITQEHYVFNSSVRDNVRLARPEAHDSEVKAALESVGATWVDSLPEGLDTVLGDGGNQLDPAEAQQLALARVIVADPPVVILDEATAGIAPENAGGVERALSRALEGRTVLAIAHQLDAARTADQIAVVSEGRIAELGTHQQLVNHDGQYAHLWRAWKNER